MTALAWFYGALTMAVLVVAVIDHLLRKGGVIDPSPVFASAVLLVFWAISNGVKLAQPSALIVILPPMDALGLAGSMMLYRHRRAPWKIALAFCFLAQLCLHVAFHTVSVHSPVIEWRYWTGLDVFFVLSLIATGSVGVGHGLRHLGSLFDLGRSAPKAMVRR